MSLGITIGDSSFRAEVPVSRIAEWTARKYQSSIKYPLHIQGDALAGPVSAEGDFARVCYNVKQIAFNVSTVAAIAFAALTAVGVFSLTTGIVFTALFWGARSLVLQEVRRMLTERGEGLLIAEDPEAPDFTVLKDKEAIQNHVNFSRESKIFLEESWKPGFDLGGMMFIWRSLIPFNAHSGDFSQSGQGSSAGNYPGNGKSYPHEMHHEGFPGNGKSLYD